MSGNNTISNAKLHIVSATATAADWSGFAFAFLGNAAGNHSTFVVYGSALGQMSDAVSDIEQSRSDYTAAGELFKGGLIKSLSPHFYSKNLKFGTPFILGILEGTLSHQFGTVDCPLGSILDF